MPAVLAAIGIGGEAAGAAGSTAALGSLAEGGIGAAGASGALAPIVAEGSTLAGGTGIAGITGGLTPIASEAAAAPSFLSSLGKGIVSGVTGGGGEGDIPANPPEHLAPITQKIFNMMRAKAAGPQEDPGKQIGNMIGGLLSGPQKPQLPESRLPQMSDPGMLSMRPESMQLIQMLMSQTQGG